MERALFLAAQGRGRTSPNPMVGAVVVKQGSVVGEGYHLRAGGDHAEVIALRGAEDSAIGATLYVSLEPCCHCGKTPPCTERIIDSGIRRVVASMPDPNPLVCGKGFERLREAGIEVEWGLMEEESSSLNEAYIKFIATGMPFVILKGAASLDGKIATATGESRWITGPAARERVHRLRDEVDAVMVGIGTVLQDDPLLTTRLASGQGKDPLRIILDAEARLPINAKVINPASLSGTLLVTSNSCPQEKLEDLPAAGGGSLGYRRARGKDPSSTLIEKARGAPDHEPRDRGRIRGECLGPGGGGRGQGDPLRGAAPDRRGFCSFLDRGPGDREIGRVLYPEKHFPGAAWG